MFTKKILFSIILTVLFLSGCATLPPRGAVPAYSLNGVSYFSLAGLCNIKGLDLQYDTYTRTAVLAKGAQRIKLRVGDPLILVNGSPMHLAYPPDLYQGALVVPSQFRVQVLDNLFKEEQPAGRRASLVRIRKVIIDPGHGGNDPGAIGRTGLREDEVNLDIAKRLRKLLISSGVEVVMTRDSDRFITLPRRVDMANNSGADLFISIHSNANPSKSMNGFEVYYVATSVSDSKRALLSANNSRINLGSLSFASSSRDLKVIVWDMIYTNSRAESIELSRSICKAIDRGLDTKINGVKGARYYVLKGAHIPAVLIEIGFLSNSGEERLLRTSSYRQKIAQGIFEGIDDYAQDTAIMEASKR